MALRADGDGLRRAGTDERVSVVAAFRTEVDDPVCRFDDVEVVLDDDDGVSVVAQAGEDAQQKSGSVFYYVKSTEDYACL